MTRSTFLNAPVDVDASLLQTNLTGSSAPTVEKDGHLSHLSFKIASLEVSMNQIRILLQGLMEQQNALSMTMDHLIRRDDDDYFAM